MGGPSQRGEKSGPGLNHKNQADQDPVVPFCSICLASWWVKRKETEAEPAHGGHVKTHHGKIAMLGPLCQKRLVDTNFHVHDDHQRVPTKSIPIVPCAV